MKKFIALALLFALPFCSKAQCYCTPAWYYSSGCGSAIVMLSSASQHLMLNGASGAINDSTSCDTSGYKDHTPSMVCTLNSGSSYVMTVGYSGSYSQSYQVWIDFNSNAVFETSECVGGDSASSGATGRHINIVIPSGSNVGTKRMRVETEYNYHAYPHLSPCPDGTSASSYYYGEVRDYSVIIDTPSAYLTASTSSISFAPTSAGSSSSPSAFVVSAGYLTPASGNVTVSASPHFSVCSTAGGTYVSSYTISYSGAAISATSIYVKFNAPSTPGSYTGNVCISGCGLATGTCLVTSGSSAATLDVLNLSGDGDFDMFPNPASDEIMINMEERAFSSLVVTDYVGSVVAEQSINRSQTKLNIKNLAPGIYYVKLVGDGSSVVKRFVKL